MAVLEKELVVRERWDLDTFVALFSEKRRSIILTGGMIANVDLEGTSIAAVIEAFILGELLKKQDLMKP